ncbi:CBL-interacting protein kinase 2-like [Bidens hawaiensis]|uniref:CBL-interacting protein kinase 2-like n=1 Tax=Bidens hawaiensis TaxID=980011 RepID=UPI004049096A
MDSKGVVLMQRYELGKLLGHGNFAKVYHARNLANGTSVAVKVIDKNKVLRTGMMTHIKREISVMRLLKHPNIVRLYEVLATKTKIYFILEYVKGGELFDKLSKGKLKEEAARIYFRQLISAIGFCHNRGVYHRDLKPENLLLDDEENLKVSDFGLSALAETKRQDGLLHTCCGSPAYVAPEVINQKGYDGAKADIWSCGVVLFVLLAGFLPFHDSNLIEMYRKIALARFKFPNSFPAAAKSLVFKMLDPNPLTRISIAGIVGHPWFKTGLVETNTVTTSTSADSVGAGGGSVGCCNAFDIISLSRGLNLSGLFSDNGEDDKEVRFMLKQPGATIVSRLEELAMGLKMKVVKKNEVILRMEGLKDLVVDFEVFEIMPNVSLIEVELVAGDRVGFQEMMSKHVKPVLKSV